SSHRSPWETSRHASNSPQAPASRAQQGNSDRNESPERQDFRLNFSVDVFLGLAAGVRGGAAERGAHGLGVAPERARGIHRLARLPFALAGGELALRDLDVDRALDGVDLDDIAVLQERDWPAQRRLGADMAHAKPA